MNIVVDRAVSGFRRIENENLTMPGLNYGRGKVRKAMLIAPMAGLIGVLPFLFQLNLTFVQFLVVCLMLLIVCYIGGLVLGAPGYLILRRLGYTQSKYLMAYAALLVVVAPLLLDDVYALLSFGPPILLSAGAFCFIRGSAIDSENGADPQLSGAA